VTEGLLEDVVDGKRLIVEERCREVWQLKVRLLNGRNNEAGRTARGAVAVVYELAGSGVDC